MSFPLVDQSPLRFAGLAVDKKHAVLNKTTILPFIKKKVGYHKFST